MNRGPGLFGGYQAILWDPVNRPSGENPAGVILQASNDEPPD